ncbi:MAG TPA: HAMP domain-containing sensor histidine kinase [Steroidobacteraceae bacterium]
MEYLAPWAIQEGKKIGFEGPETVVRVRGDSDALNDALRNLVENAVVHTPTGTEVAVMVSSNGSVSVSDSGPGVKPDDKPYVFDRFWRGKGERNPGAGLGLAIVAEIARAHRGTVEVGESPEGGAKFTITLPPAAAH